MSRKEYPVVFRFASIKPAALSRIEMHAKRSGGPIDNIEIAHSHRNKVYVGQTFAKEMRAEIRRIKRQNLREEVAACLARKRKKDAVRRQAEGPTDPWHGNCEGPLREVVLGAHKDYFAADGSEDFQDLLTTYGIADDGSTVVNVLSKTKIAAFEKATLAFIDQYFAGTVQHLRLDLDEDAPHFHAVLMMTSQTTSKSRGTQTLLRPSDHPLIADYELAQDVAGEHFSSIGLTRGEKHAEARRDAKAAGLPIPDAQRHVPPRQYREERARRIKAHEDALTARDAILDVREMNVFLDEHRTTGALVCAESTRASVEAEKAKFEDMRSAADSLKTEASAYAVALTEGTAAVIDRRLDYQPASGDKKDGLCDGPAASEDPEERASLWQRIQPAYARLVEFAAGLFKRQAAMNREMAAIQAELRRQASVLADGHRMAKRSIPVLIQAIMDTTAGARLADYDRASFPDAWIAPATADPAKVDRELAEMTNGSLRQRYVELPQLSAPG
ncbi:hypothetical protein ACR03S_02440 [Limimaricola variabilis]